MERERERWRERRREMERDGEKGREMERDGDRRRQTEREDKAIMMMMVLQSARVAICQGNLTPLPSSGGSQNNQSISNAIISPIIWQCIMFYHGHNATALHHGIHNSAGR